MKEQYLRSPIISDEPACIKWTFQEVGFLLVVRSGFLNEITKSTVRKESFNTDLVQN